jgi:hypothetical protein
MDAISWRRYWKPECSCKTNLSTAILVNPSNKTSESTRWDSTSAARSISSRRWVSSGPWCGRFGGSSQACKVRVPRPTRCADQNHAAAVQISGGHEARLTIIPACILSRHHPAREHQFRVGEIGPPKRKATRATEPSRAYFISCAASSLPWSRHVD